VSVLRMLVALQSARDVSEVCDLITIIVLCVVIASKLKPQFAGVHCSTGEFITVLCQTSPMKVQLCIFC